MKSSEIYKKYLAALDERPGILTGQPTLQGLIDTELGVVQHWVFEMILRIVYNCECAQSRQYERQCPVDRQSTDPGVQIKAVAKTIHDWLDRMALDHGMDPYDVINARDTDEIYLELINSPELQANFEPARLEIAERERKRNEFIYGGGLARQNEARLQRASTGYPFY